MKKQNGREPICPMVNKPCIQERCCFWVKCESVDSQSNKQTECHACMFVMNGQIVTQLYNRLQNVERLQERSRDELKNAVAVKFQALAQALSEGKPDAINKD